MDALLSTYASSDDEEPPSTKPLFSSLPKPSISSTKDPTFSTKPSSLFSHLPPPNTHFTPTLPPKRLVQFRPPLPLKDPAFRPDEDDDEDEDEFDRKKRKQLNNNGNTSVKSFLSTIPAPKNTGFGSGLSGSQGTRISIDNSPAIPDIPVPDIPVPAPSSVEEYNVDNGLNSYGYEATSYGNYDQGYYGNDGGVAVRSDQGYCGNDGGGTVASEVDRYVSMSGGGGRRRKEQMPTEIVEVKQDELMKNRPTQDKAKLTGIAFGPSYQPVSAKGKPSKLHKRKHQISALYYDMKQKEPEFAERRAKGFLTKSETQAKYGW